MIAGANTAMSIFVFAGQVKWNLQRKPGRQPVKKTRCGRQITVAVWQWRAGTGVSVISS
jgi:hypothetical protein